MVFGTSNSDIIRSVWRRLSRIRRLTIPSPRSGWNSRRISAASATNPPTVSAPVETFGTVSASRITSDPLRISAMVTCRSMK